MLQTSLFIYELWKKVNVDKSFFLRTRMHEPRSIRTEIEFDYCIDVWAENWFKDEFTNILIFVFILAEFIHVQDFYGRIILDYLPEHISYR